MYLGQDFWDDDGTSEFDEMIYDLKRSLKNQVRQEIKDKIERLEKEIEELREFRDKKNEYDTKMRDMEYKLKMANQDVEEKARRMKYNDFIKVAQSPAWCIDGKYEYIKDKCDKCDDRRRLHFKSPSGKDFEEDCPYCSQKKYISRPVEGVLVQLEHVDKYYSSNAEFADVQFSYLVPESFKRKYGKEDHDCSWITTISKVYNGEKFSYDNRYSLMHTYFRNKETCEKACEFLNNEDNKKGK